MAVAKWNWDGTTVATGTAEKSDSPIHIVAGEPRPDARTLAYFIGPADIRAFLRVYRSAVGVTPWTGVGPEPVADPTTPHARVEAWLAALSEA